MRWRGPPLGLREPEAQFCTVDINQRVLELRPCNEGGNAAFVHVGDRRDVGQYIGGVKPGETFRAIEMAQPDTIP
jgi:hypothetical protein